MSGLISSTDSSSSSDDDDGIPAGKTFEQYAKELRGFIEFLKIIYRFIKRT